MYSFYVLIITALCIKIYAKVCVAGPVGYKRLDVGIRCIYLGGNRLYLPEKIYICRT